MIARRLLYCSGGPLVESDPLLRLGEGINELWQVGFVETGGLAPLFADFKAPRAGDGVAGHALAVIRPDCGFDATDLDFMCWFAVHISSLFWFLPNGIGSVKSSRSSGALSCPTRILGAGRVLTAPRGCYVSQNANGRSRRNDEEQAGREGSKWARHNCHVSNKRRVVVSSERSNYANERAPQFVVAIGL